MATELYTEIANPVFDSITSALDRLKTGNIDKEEKRLQKEISKIREEMNEKYDNLNSDNDILCSLYRDITKANKDGLGAAAEIKKALEDLKKLTSEMEDELMEYLYGGWGSGKTWEEMFGEIFDPVLAALPTLMNITDTLGLGQIPLINKIPEMLQKFAELGRIVSRLPREVREQARAEAEAAEKAAKEERQKGMTWRERQYDNIKHSFVGRLIDEIIDVFKAIWDLIQFILQSAELFAILLIIDKFKPILDAFKVVIGDAVELLTGIKEVLQAVVQGKYAIMKLLWKVIYAKFESLNNILIYITSGTNLPSNAMISACLIDIVSCECDISSLQLSLDYEMINLDIHTDNKLKLAYEEEKKKIEAYVEKLNEETPPDEDEIQLMDDYLSTIKEEKEKLEDRLLSSNKDRETSKNECEHFEKNKAKKFRNILKERTDQNEFLNPVEDTKETVTEAAAAT